MAKKHSGYFDTFVQLTDYSLQAASYLQAALKDFDPATLAEKRLEMHEIEHAADNEKHRMMKMLAREFVTPIEREDIVELANEIDEVIDKIEDVLIRIYMYNIREIRAEALALADVIARCCRALLEAMREFHNFQRSEYLHQAIVEVNTMEEEGDAIYIDAMRRLYVEEKDAVTVVAWNETFDRLEDCCDSCEHVANVMESIVMKNS